MHLRLEGGMLKYIRWVLVFLLLLFLPIIIGWLLPEPTDPTAGRAECPHKWELHRMLNSGPATSPIRNIPEFHDCQRFILADGNREIRYDSLYAIFASFQLAALEGRLDSLAQVYGAGGRALPAAEIYSESGTYPSLGIKTTFSCLFVFHASDWKAVMVPEPNDNSDCISPEDPSKLRGTPLEVRRSEFAKLTDQDYPPVARWDWDTVNLKQYIGIKCGAGWCEIGEPGFVSSPGYPDDLSRPTEFRKTRVVKGWYDEQWLATVKAGKVEPTRIRGTIFPDMALGTYNAKSDFQWVPVAHVAVDGPPAEYKTKFNFDKAAPESPTLNTISMCYGSRYQCLGALYAWWPWLKPMCGSGDQWYDRTVALDGSSKFRCVTQRPAPNAVAEVPATTRWRWLASDETSWKRCMLGCCESH
jgi:hypothetical protein